MSPPRAEMHFRTCNLCEAMCGIAIEVEDGRILSIRGDDDDPVQPRPHLPEGGRAAGPARRSRIACAGRCAARGTRLGGDRLGRGARRGRRAPGARSRRRTAATRSPSTRATRPSTTTAPSLFGQLLAAQPGHAQPLLGDVGRPAAAHAGGAARCSATSSCCPCRTSTARGYFLVLGANPLASNGSLMTAPDIERAAEGAARARRPARRRRSAAHRDGGARRPAPRPSGPGTDALLLLALLHVALRRGAGAARARWRRSPTGSTTCARSSRRSRPSASAGATGIAGGRRSAQLARDFAARRAAVCVRPRRRLARRSSAALASLARQRRSTSSPATSTGRAARCSRRRRSTSSRWPRASASAATSTRAAAACAACRSSAASSRWPCWPRRSRRRAPGQIRALVTSAGNPVLSTPNGAPPRARARRPRLHGLDRLLPERDHAPRAPHPAARPSPLEHDHYDLVFHAARRAQHRQVLAGALRRPRRTRATTGRSCSSSRAGVDARQGPLGCAPRSTHAAPAAAWARAASLDLLLRTGPYGARRRPFGAA